MAHNGIEERGILMHILLLYLIGIALGRLTSILAGWRSPQRDYVNLCVGITGALLGGLALARKLHAPISVAAFNGGALLIAAATAAALLALLTLGRCWFERRGPCLFRE